ncbi:MAG: MFS transporter [Spirochaetia bacterium]|nr:MFS transporter [Spirochaetia bacterium]
MRRKTTTADSEAEALALIRPRVQVSEGFLLFLLSAMQFTNILDFVIMMPLGPQFFRAFSIGPYEFGLLVSSYSISAFVTGIFAGFFLDRFDRKTSLLAIYAGFGAGTLLCAFAPSYWWLMAGRITAGAFGGIMSATILAIVGDAVPEGRRGAAMGTIMGSFSVATIAGVPLGLFLAHLTNWQAPFLLLAAMSLGLWGLASLRLPSFKTHMDHAHEHPPAARFLRLFTNPARLNAYLFMLAVIFAGFSVIPYIAPYLVGNVGLPEGQLSYVYFFGGACTFFSARYVGRLADRFGKPRIFALTAVLACIPLVLLTNLPVVPSAVVFLVTTLFMVFVSGRIIPAMAMITASAPPQERGSFMSIVTAVQHVGSGLAALTAGAILANNPDGRLLHYDRVGYMAAAISLVSILVSRRVKPAVGG